MRRVLQALGGASAVLGAVLFGSAPADAAPPDKPAVLASWTQTSVASYNAWNAARQNQASWAAYKFDWSTDYCTTSPDNPVGFDFRLACQRHDFGYRNYGAAGQFPANKSRLDDMFHQDLSRRCDTYNAAVRPACDSLAWTYYQAARQFGEPFVSAADLERAARMKADGLRAAELRGR